MAILTIDPVTRIEGHLKIDVNVASGTITDAWSSGTLFRGIEKILIGRKPEDAWLFTQRVCGVCTLVHGLCSVRSIENAIGAVVHPNARVLRNLLMGTQFLHDHLVHFYHLSMLDWVDVKSALTADPDSTSILAKAISPNAPEIDFAVVLSRLRSLAESGKLGIFAGGYAGHPAYELDPNENLLMVAHYIEALAKQTLAGRMHAIWGAKNPHLQSLRVGGVTCASEITTARIGEFLTLLRELRVFIDTVYLPDVSYLAQRYSNWFQLGGSDNFMVYGEFPETEVESESQFFPQGLILDRNVDAVSSVSVAEIAEHVAHSWYSGNLALSPAVGVTEPAYSGYDAQDRYSWIKAPRYSSKAVEVGPLARILVAYGRDHAKVQVATDQVLSRLRLDLSSLNSTFGRIVARALETQLIAERMESVWLGSLDTTEPAYTPLSTAVTARGIGLNEAPRGALGHWASIQAGALANYQMVVPSTWNFGPRCAAGILGPIEKALIGTPLVDVTQPLEALRTIHSLDPCVACAVHATEGQRHLSIKEGVR